MANIKDAITAGLKHVSEMMQVRKDIKREVVNPNKIFGAGRTKPKLNTAGWAKQLQKRKMR